VNEFYDDEVEINVALIGLYGRSENRKQAPNGEERGPNIHRAPTFLFLKDREKIGQIVEEPSTSLETDIAQIYEGLAPKPNYRVANYLLQ